MSISAPLQSNFDGGEVSPLLYGRVDSDRYKSSLALCKNWLVTLQGPLLRRPGTQFLGTVKDPSAKTRLIPFQFSTTQAYMLEFGNNYVRVWADYGQVLNTGVPVEISTPYTTSDIQQLKFTQSADTLWLVHPSYAPMTLTRQSQTSWTLAIFSLRDGPYDTLYNTVAATVSFSAVSGSVTVTGSVGLFVPTDVGGPTDLPLQIRVQNGANSWTWLQVTAYSGPTSVTATVMGPNLASTSANGDFRLSSWTNNKGYPSTIAFHQDRLCFSGTRLAPQRIDMSEVSDYNLFSPTETDGTVIDSDACDFSLNSNDVNFMQWLSSDANGLLCGSSSAEWLISPSTAGAAIAPTNVNASRNTRWGSTSTQAIQVGRGTIFVQKGGRKIRELLWFWDISGYRATDITELAEHITGTGISAVAYTANVHPIIWMLRNDGALIGATYDRDMTQLRIGWHQHALGGQSDAAGSPPIIESIASIPSPDGTIDDLWMIVQRRIGGFVVRSMEYMEKVFEDIDPQQNAYHLDCGLTYNNPIAITVVIQSNPAAIVTTTPHGFTTGDKVRFDSLVGMSQLNGNKYAVTVTGSNAFTITDLHGNPVDSTSFSAYVSSGQVRKLVTTISGLSYLNGETVAIYADGAVQSPQVVSAGSITLEAPAAVVSVGYSYNSDGQTLRPESGARNGTALGKTRRTHRVGFMVHRSQGLQVGKSFTALDPVEFRTQGIDPNGASSPLFSGIESHTMDFNYDFENQICFRVSGPQPCTMQAIMPMLETQDRA